MLRFMITSFVIVLTCLSGCTSSFIQSASKGDIAGVKRYISNDVDVDEADNFGKTALMAASENGHLEIVKELIQYESNINAQDLSGIIFTISARNSIDDSAMTHSFISSASFQDSVILTDSLTYTLIDTLFILNKLKSTNHKVSGNMVYYEPVNNRDYNGCILLYVPPMSAISYASKNGYLAVVEYLLKQEAFISDGRALIEAVENSYHEIVKYLLNNGADVNKRVSYYDHSNFLDATLFGTYTALMKAISNDGIDMVRLLIEYEADINEVNLNCSYINGMPAFKMEVYTPLNFALEKNNGEIVNMLKKHRAINYSNDTNYSASLMLDVNYRAGRYH